MEKKEKDRIAASTSFELTSEEPYDTFVAQVLVRIANLLVPKKLDIQDYDIAYTIKRVESRKNSLKHAQDFAYLLERASTTEKPEIKVIVTQKAPKKVSKVSFTRNVCLVLMSCIGISMQANACVTNPIAMGVPPTEMLNLRMMTTSPSQVKKAKM